MHGPFGRWIAALLLTYVATAVQAGGTPINVGNLVWNDLDADGTRDAGEPGVGGVTVQLWNDPRTQLLDSATTSGAGSYTLQAPGPGSYRVRVVLPSVTDSFSPKDAAADDTSDSDINPTGALQGFTDTYVFPSNLISITSIDAGLVRAPIAVGDRVWNDIDADGIQDVSEPGVAGILVELWDDTKTFNLRNDTTDANGIYQLQAPGPGNYRVRVTKRSIDTFSPKDAGASDALDSDVNPSGVDGAFTDVLAVTSASVNVDCGIVVTPTNVGNLVWNDLDADGTRDAGEPGVGGVTVQLWNDPRTQLLDSTTTSATGSYTLQAFGPGSYRVRVVLPSVTDAFSPKDAAADDTSDSDINPTGALLGFTDTYVFAPNLISISSIDAGLVRAPIALGNRVWNDFDADGIQDGGEPGIEGIVVELWDETKTFNLRSDTTDANGIYQLQAPGPGNYRVRVTKRSIDTFPPKDAGASDALDSDVNPAGVDAAFTDVLVVTAASNDVDGGIVRAPINVGNFVWNDLDRDGVQDTGEPGLPAVTVQLWNAARTQLLDSTTTSATGNYTLQAPGPGDYRVRVVLLPVHEGFSPLNTPPSDLLDSDINPAGTTLGFTDVLTLASNLISTTTVDGGILTSTLFADGFE